MSAATNLTLSVNGGGTIGWLSTIRYLSWKYSFFILMKISARLAVPPPRLWPADWGSSGGRLRTR